MTRHRMNMQALWKTSVGSHVEPACFMWLAGRDRHWLAFGGSSGVAQMGRMLPCLYAELTYY